jgi:hypothetical protein
MRFFFYGTLLDEGVRRIVLGRVWADALSLRPATLQGWRRLYMRDRTYPVILPSPGDQVDGLLTGPVDREGYRRLTAFESDEYVERDVAVVTEDGVETRARIYAAGARARAATEVWTLENWTREHRVAFLRRIAGIKF